MKAIVGFLFLLSVSAWAQSNVVTKIKEADCKLDKRPELYSETSTVEASELNGKGALAELESQKWDYQRDHRDFFGILRFREAQRDIKFDKEVPHPEDPCAPWWGAQLYRRCSAGEDESRALCVTYCNRFYNSYVDCR